MEKTKRMWNFIFLIMTTVCCLSLTSCGSDDEDDNNDVNTPAAFEDYAAKYQLTGTDSPYSSVEFTESGNYIITERYYNANTRSPYISKPSTRKFTFANLLHKTATRSGDAYSLILYGTYTVDTDGTYILSDYGKVKVTQDASGNAYSLVFMPNGGSSYTYNASKQNRDLNSSNSSRLCRTWNINSYQSIMKVNGKTIIDITANSNKELAKKAEEWAKEHDEEYDPSDWDDDDIIELEQIIFTKTGTYMVKYEGDQLAVAAWKWRDYTETELAYAWDNILEYPEGYASISYKNNQLVITEKVDEDEYEDGTYEEYLIMYLSESK